MHTLGFQWKKLAALAVICLYGAQVLPRGISQEILTLVQATSAHLVQHSSLLDDHTFGIGSESARHCSHHKVEACPPGCHCPALESESPSHSFESGASLMPCDSKAQSLLSLSITMPHLQWNPLSQEIPLVAKCLFSAANPLQSQAWPEPLGKIPIPS